MRILNMLHQPILLSVKVQAKLSLMSKQIREWLREGINFAVVDHDFIEALGIKM